MNYKNPFTLRDLPRLVMLLCFAYSSTLTGGVDTQGLPVAASYSGQALSNTVDTAAQADGSETIIDCYDQPRNADWMSGKWGIGWRIPSGNGDEVRSYDPAISIAQIQTIENLDYVLINISRGANGLRYAAPHSALDALCTGCTPRDDQGNELDIFLPTIQGFKNAGYKVLVYMATEGPAKLKHGDVKAFDYDATLGYSPSVSAWKNYVLNGLYPTLSLTDDEKFKKAFAEIIVAEYANRYGDLIDGWWFDHATYGDIPLLHSVIKTANPNTVVAFNDGQKVPLTNNNPGYEDYTFGHPTPVAQQQSSSDANLPMITSIESAPDGYFESNGDYSLGHMFMPLQNVWNSGDVVWTQELAIERLNRVLAANGAWTWNIGNNKSIENGDWSTLDSDAIAFLQQIDSAIGGACPCPFQDTDNDGICDANDNVSSCTPSIVLDQNIEIPFSLHAVNEISSNSITPASSASKYTAGQYIQLTPGFEVQPGAIFHAYIFECDPHE